MRRRWRSGGRGRDLDALTWPSRRRQGEASKNGNGPDLLVVRPLQTAGNVKKELRWQKYNAETKQMEKKPRSGVIVFNPNSDNAYLMKGDPEAANAIWLLNWRKALDRAKKTGGRCVQIIVAGGLPEMQEAEASMAEDKGVPVVRLDCSEVKYYAELKHFEEMAGWAELMALAPKERVSRDASLSFLCGCACACV